MIIATHGIVASQILTVPVATAATSVGESSFTANWNAYTGASYYLLDVSLNSSFSSYVLQDQVTTSTSYVVTGLSSNTTYYYRIRANVGTDPDAQAFFDRVTTAGGSLSATEQTAIDTLVIQMKVDGIWTKMKAIYPMVGASAAACSQNLKSSSFTGTFTSGWTFASSGVTPNGTSAYFDTALNTSTQLTKTTAHLSTYIRTDSAIGSPYDIGNSGNFGATIEPTYLISRYAGNNAYFGIADTSYATSILSTNSLGFWCGATNGSSTQKLYKNGSSIVSGTAASGGFANNNLYIGANNGGGTANLFSNKQTAFASIGDGLTDTEASNLYTAVQTFNQALNRQVGPQIVSDADAQDYINRVYTAGGTLTDTEANAVNQLTIDMKADGIWTKMKAIYPMVGASAAACAQNLKSSSFTGTFSSGWTFASTGIQGNGTSAYFDTTFNPNTSISDINSSHLSIYSRTTTGNNAVDMGVATPAWDIEIIYSAFYAGMMDGNYLSTANADAKGLWTNSRISSSSVVAYRNSSTFVSGTNSPTTKPNYNVYIGARNDLNVAKFFSNREFAFASIGDGLTSTNVSNFYTAVQTFNQTLSRNV